MQLVVSLKLFEILKKNQFLQVFDFTRNIIIGILQVLGFTVLQKIATIAKLHTFYINCF